ncbi:MAG: InlB B-repeat-containing protein [Oligoflexales bacterium]|nr:InlB B-repeat-containing protein [Oligoflexales bacterium]
MNMNIKRSLFFFIMFPVLGMTGCDANVVLYTSQQEIDCDTNPDSRACQIKAKKDLQNLKGFRLNEKYALTELQSLDISWSVPPTALTIKFFKITLTKEKECRTELFSQQVGAKDLSATINDVQEGIYYCCLYAKTSAGIFFPSENNGLRIVVDRTLPAVAKDDSQSTAASSVATDKEAGNTKASSSSNSPAIAESLLNPPKSPGFSSTYSNSQTVTLSFTVGSGANFSTHNAMACTQSDCATGCLSKIVTATSPAVLTGLSNGSSYYGCVQSQDKAAGVTGWVASLNPVIIDITPPANPTAVSVPLYTYSNLSITFTPGVEGNPGNFNTKACLASDCSGTCYGSTATPSSPGYVSAASLTSGVSYYGCVQATDLAGNTSAWAASASTAIYNPIYTITYDGNGHTGGTVPTDGAAYTVGQSITVLGNSGSLVKTGYVFGGWNTAAIAGSGTTYSPGQSFAMGTANVTLYAVWLRFWSLPQNAASYTGIATNRILSVYTSGSNIYIGTSHGLSISTNSGSTWMTKTTSNGLGSNIVNGVFALGSNIYAATENGLAISTDSGSSWTNYTTVQGLGSNIVNDVVATSSGTNIFAATNNGLSYSTDAGSTWTNKTTAAGLGSNTVNSVYASGTYVYAATSGGLSISTNTCSTWSNKTTADGLGSDTINKVYAPTTSDIYAATSAGVSYSTNSGTSWSNKTTADGVASNNVFSIYASGSDIYAGTDSGLSISTNSGTSWTNYTTASGLGSNTINGVYTVSSNIYAATDMGLAISTNSGSTWSNLTTSGSFNVEDIGSVWATGSSIWAGTWWGGLAKSIDGGASFTTLPSSGPNGPGSSVISGVCAYGSNVYAGTYASGNAVAVSLDSGSTWTTYSTPTIMDVNASSIYCDQNTVYLGVFTAFSFSSDSGTTWTNKPTTNPWHFVGTTPGLPALDSWGFTAVFGDGMNLYAGSHSSGLGISNDGGSSWTTITTTQGLASDAVLSINASGSKIYVGTEGGLSVSANGGTSWTNYTTANGLPSNVINSIYAVGSTIYAGTDVGLAISVDSGANWTSFTALQGLAANTPVYSIFVRGPAVYVGTAGGLFVANPAINVQ